MDINEKLRSLTPEQANKLAGHLNSCYPDKKKPAPAKKKPAAKGGKKKKRIRRAAEGAMPPAAFSVPSRREVTRFGKGRK